MTKPKFVTFDELHVIIKVHKLTDNQKLRLTRAIKFLEQDLAYFVECRIFQQQKDHKNIQVETTS